MDEILRQKFIDAFLKEDLDIVEEMLEEHGYAEDGEADEDFYEEVFCLALNYNCYDYIEKHVEDIDLYGTDYIAETDDEDIIDLLCENGASIPWEVYADKYIFACELVEGSILSFDPDFQKKVFEKFLEVTGLSEEDLIEKLEDGYDFVEQGIDDYEIDDDCDDFEYYDEPIYNELTLLEYCKGIGFYVEDGEIVFHEFKYLQDENQLESKDVLIALGWELSAVGQCCQGPRMFTPEVYFLPKDKE